ncbi:UEV domain-containing protein [Microdochium trichocladiopsis]|uniref:UEV domain-containing protein n=1 Tax=Microdochium trichocladiopsis TaxID=1682393 RepID=A0A9P9BQC4_9PEZI|nr:UEV domain-containing protein [Microdochium trichocladiopsis]KAH7030708.1 UEV domain-containing protein [Microdochium trichocladiopsis]
MAVQQHVLNWLYSVLTSEYHDVNRTYNDVATCLAQYPSLAPRTDAHTFDNGVSALLLHLSGTIPVVFRGTTYRFPVAIWVPHAYPREPPLVYVTPNEAMMVRPGQHVDPQGRVYHPYLTAWPGFWDKSSVADLLAILRDVFAKEPPVVARPQGPSQTQPGIQAQAPAAPTPPPIPPHPSATASPSHQGHSHSQVHDYGNKPPPPPPKGDQGNNIRPNGPPLPPLPPGHRQSQPAPYSASSIQSPQMSTSRYDSAPPLPHQQASQVAPQYQHQYQHQSQQYQQRQHNHTPQQLGQPPPNVQAGPIQQQYGPPPHQQSPPPAFQGHGQFNSQDPRYSAGPPPPVGHQHRDSPAQSPPGSTIAGAYPGPPPGWQRPGFPQHQQPPPMPAQIQQRPPPPPDIMDEPLTLALPSSSNAPAAPPIPPNPEKDALLRQLAVTLYDLRQHARQQNETSLAGLAAQKNAMLAALQNLQSDAASLAPVSAMLASNTQILQASLREADAVISNSKNQPKPNIDELLVAPTVVGNQLYDLVAEERALGDAIFVLGRAVERGNLSPQVFAKTTRSLAREWYLKKALVRKIGKGMGLIV